MTAWLASLAGAATIYAVLRLPRALRLGTIALAAGGAWLCCTLTATKPAVVERLPMPPNPADSPADYNLIG